MLLALIGLITSAAFWPGMAGAADDARWTALGVVLPISLCFVALRPNRIYWLGFAFVAYAEISLLWTPVPYDGVAEMMQLLVLVCAFLFAHSQEDLRPFFSWAGLGLWISSGIAILQAMGYDPVIKAPGNLAPGLFLNQDVLGPCAVVVLVALVIDRTWWIATGVVPALVLSQCRTAWLAGLCCFIIYGWRRWPKWRPAFLLGPALFTVIAYYFGRGDASLRERFGMWGDVIAGLTPFGHGIGSFYSALPAHATFVDSSSIELWHAHNDILELAFELGIPGIVLAFAFGGLVFWRAGERERLVLVALGVTACLLFPFHNPATTVIFGLVAGFAARSWDPVRDRQLHSRPALHDRRQRFALGRTRDGGPHIPVSARIPSWPGAAGDPRQ